MDQDLNNKQETAQQPTLSQTPPVVPEASLSQTPPASATNQPKKDNNLLIIIGLIIIMAIVLGGLYFYTMSASTKPNPKTNVVETQPIATATPSPSPVMDETIIDTLDTGDPTLDLDSINTDLQEL